MTKKATTKSTNRSTYEVQIKTLCEGWVNTWTTSDSDGNDAPRMFATKTDAQAGLDEFLNDVRSQIASGERNQDEGYEHEQFRIVESTRDDGGD